MWINAKMTAQIIALMDWKMLDKVRIILTQTKTKETICVFLFSKEQFLLHLTKW